MAKFQQVLDSLGTQPKSSSSNNKKRKWREIEQLKEKFQLEKDLKAFDDSLECVFAYVSNTSCILFSICLNAKPDAV